MVLLLCLMRSARAVWGLGLLLGRLNTTYVVCWRELLEGNLAIDTMCKQHCNAIASI